MLILLTITPPLTLVRLNRTNKLTTNDNNNSCCSPINKHGSLRHSPIRPPHPQLSLLCGHYTTWPPHFHLYSQRNESPINCRVNLRTRRITTTATEEADCELQKLSDRIDGHLFWSRAACPFLNIHTVQNCGRYGGALKLNYIPTNGSSAPSVATVAVAATGGRGAETLLNLVVYCGAIHVPPD